MSINFNTFPYYDDYTPDKNFYKILFKAGYAVQARELNQMQSILQHQISTFANHIFKKNSMVIPGGINLNRKAPLLFTSNVELAAFVGKTITNAPLDNGVYPTTNSAYFNDYITAVVLGYKDADDLYPSCLYVKYFNSYKGTDPATDPSRSNFVLDDLIYTLENNPQQIVLTSTGVGVGKVAAIDKGVFYTKELFVDVPSQSIIIEANTNIITNCNIGLNIIESIVDYTQDDSLFDNAQGFPNQYAPGADRYKVELVLSRIDFNSTINDDKFINLMSIENDTITYLNVNAQYAELMKTLAKRTYDANGNFIVNGLIPTVTKSNSDDYVWVSVGRGSCYLGGYEYSQITDINIPIAKPRDDAHTETVSNVTTYINQLPFFYVAGGKNIPNYPDYVPFMTYMPSPNELIQFIRSVPPESVISSDIIGYGVFKSMEYYCGVIGDLEGPSNVVYKMYVDNISLKSGISLKDIGGYKKIGASSVGAPILHEISIDTPPNPVEAANDAHEDMFARPIYSSNIPPPPATVGNDFREIGYLYYSGNNKLYLLKKASDYVIPDTTTLHTWLNIPLTRTATFISNYTGDFYPIIQVDPTNIKTLKPTATNGLQPITYSIIKEYSATLVDNNGVATANFSAINGAEFEDFSVNDYSLFVIMPITNEALSLTLTSSNIIFNNQFTSLTVEVDAALVDKEIRLYTTQVKTNAIETIYTTQNGSITIPTPSSSWMALGHTNVQELVSVLDTGDITVEPNDIDDAKIDITSRYTLDTMTTASGLYTSLIKLKKRAIPPSGQLLVTYKYNEIGDGDFSSIDSYVDENDTTYSYIGKIKNIYDNNKTPIPIRNYLDFRPVYYNTVFKNYGYTKPGINTQIFLKDLNISAFRDLFNASLSPTLYIIGPGIEHGVNIVNIAQTNGDTVVNIGNTNGQNKGTYYIGVPASFQLSNVSKEFVYPKSLAKLNYGYIKFKPKHIHLYVNREGDNLSIAQKEILSSHEIDQYRRDEYKLPLAYIYLAPYTTDMADLSMKVYENPVYKMLDIHDIKRQVDRNEYYTSLSLNNESHQLTMESGIEALELSNKGFWNEDFQNAFSQDFDSDDYKCTLYDKSYVAPGTITKTINMDRINTEANGFYKVTGSSITLPYTTVRAFGSSPASTFNNLNPYNVMNWSGKLTLNPTVDNWVDTVTLPVITKAVIITDTPPPPAPPPAPAPIPVIPPPPPPPIVPPLIMPPLIVAPPPIVPPPPVIVEEIVTEINLIKTSWGIDTAGGSHAITFTWKTNLGRTGRVNSDVHLMWPTIRYYTSLTPIASWVTMTSIYDGTFATSLINRRYLDPDVKAYLNIGTYFDTHPPAYIR